MPSLDRTALTYPYRLGHSLYFETLSKTQGIDSGCYANEH